MCIRDSPQPDRGMGIQAQADGTGRPAEGFLHGCLLYTSKNGSLENREFHLTVVAIGIAAIIVSVINLLRFSAHFRMTEAGGLPPEADTAPSGFNKA